MKNQKYVKRKQNMKQNMNKNVFTSKLLNMKY